MAKKFDLAAAISNTVSELDTGREQIEYIEEAKITADDGNFYSIDGIEALAQNIELVGLQQPLRVRPDPNDEGGYIVVSGHRRLTAIRTICKVDEPEKWKTVPCIVERGELSPAMRELRLIMANSDTRRMSGAEIAEQAERLTECLSALREEGVEFEGRTRDMVADILNVSKTRLATVKVIKEKLHERLKEMYDAGNIPESTAYRLAREDMRVQSQIYTKLSGKLPSMTEEQVAAAIEKEKQIDFETLDRAIAAKKDDAPEFSVAEYLAEREKENNRFYAAIAAMPDRFLDELRNCKTRQDGIRALKDKIGLRHTGSCGGAVDFQAGPASITIDFLGKHPITRTWTEVWDTLAVLALRRWEPNAKLPAAAVSESDTKPTWRTGNPPKAGVYWCKFDCGGTPIHQKAYWDSAMEWWKFGSKSSTKVDAECIGWYPLPEE
ncbi:MAG: ParB/RepB/Spo0J family partition protein [Oscillospiraceae bacterium]|nr:ParB/RepB/Spo0J family partition protein [Oscillospiraceae bacterium]MDY5735445.1 ParB/RepB/Spo0J family partition protein [Oscillospiraceae bacterium]